MWRGLKLAAQDVWQPVDKHLFTEREKFCVQFWFGFVTPEGDNLLRVDRATVHAGFELHDAHASFLVTLSDGGFDG